jgi:hypothetical protein
MFLDAVHACHELSLWVVPALLETLNAPNGLEFTWVQTPEQAREHEFDTGACRVEPFGGGRHLFLKGAAMTQADHYRDQSNRAKRLAKAVKDPEASQKLIEMAEEFRLYAERLEERTH